MLKHVGLHRVSDVPYQTKLLHFINQPWVEINDCDSLGDSV